MTEGRHPSWYIPTETYVSIIQYLLSLKQNYKISIFSDDDNLRTYLSMLACGTRRVEGDERKDTYTENIKNNLSTDQKDFVSIASHDIVIGNKSTFSLLASIAGGSKFISVLQKDEIIPHFLEEDGSIKFEKADPKNIEIDVFFAL